MICEVTYQTPEGRPASCATFDVAFGEDVIEKANELLEKHSSLRIQDGSLWTIQKIRMFNSREEMQSKEV